MAMPKKALPQCCKRPSCGYYMLRLQCQVVYANEEADLRKHFQSTRMPSRQGWLMQHSHHCSSFSTSQLSVRPFRPALQLHPHRSVHFAAASRPRKHRNCPFAARAFPRPHHQSSQAVRCKASYGAAFDNSDNDRPEQTARSSSSKAGYLRQQWSYYSQSFAKLAASTKLQLSAVLNPKFMPMVLL